MKKICCTIVTPDFLHKALTLLLSLKKYDRDIGLFVFTTETVKIELDEVNVLSATKLDDIIPSARDISNRYNNQPDELRWSLKPVVIQYLLRLYPDAKVLYCDSDMCFVRKPDHIYDCLDHGGIVLTPHWRPLNPQPSVRNFRLNFQDGLFNAGCVAANKEGIPALDWWANACLSACEANREQGLWHDQRYLDLMIIYFPQTVICRHRGYNLADWNAHLRRELLDIGINPEDVYPTVLIHFTANTVKKIENGSDDFLEAYYMEYKTDLEYYHKQISLKDAESNRVSYKLDASR